MIENPMHGIPFRGDLPVVTHLATVEKQVLLTFDDGPHPDASGPILDILAQRQVPAAFFLLGHNVRRYPDLVRRMQAEGHVLANHTETHPKLPEIDTAQVERELESCQEAICAVTGVLPRYFRPSYGRYDSRTLDACRKSRLVLVQWSAMVWDWLSPTVEEARSYFAAQAAPGAILLLHDGSNVRRESRAATIAMLPELIDLAREQGLRWVSLADRLLAPTQED